VYWPAGDCFLVYPGGNSSIRFENLRDGIVDFEKIRILRERAGKSSDVAAKSLLQTLDRHLQSLDEEKAFEEETIRSSVAQGKEILEELTQRLAPRRHKP
jgi:hypothetical protein